MNWRSARLGILRALGGSAAKKPYLSCPPLTPIAWDFLPLWCNPALTTNRRVRTRTHGGVTGKASDRLPDVNCRPLSWGAPA